jgi:hypothetical protein
MARQFTAIEIAKCCGNADEQDSEVEKAYLKEASTLWDEQKPASVFVKLTNGQYFRMDIRELSEFEKKLAGWT